MMLWTV